MKKYLFLLFVTLWTAGHAAEEATRLVEENPRILSIRTYTTDDSVLFAYIIDSPDYGSYFPAFLMCAAQFKDGGFTHYRIDVNGGYAGEVDPGIGGWVSAGMKGDEPLYFNKGINVMTLTERGGQVPMVEKVIFDKDFSKAVISTEAIEKRLNDFHQEELDRAKRHIEAPQTDRLQIRTKDVPLKYSYWTRRKCKEGDTLKISTLGFIPHVVDVFYHSFGLKTDLPIVGPNKIGIGTGGFVTDSMTISNKANDSFYPEIKHIETMNWKRNSDNSGYYNPTAGFEQFIEMEVPIPHDGFYCIKTRSQTSNSGGTIRISINDSEWKTVPVYYYALQADTTKCEASVSYGAYAPYNEDCDPILYVEGADGGRIVGWNDDGTGTIMDRKYKKYDSYLKQYYYMPTTAVHVSSLTAGDPDGWCRIVQDGITGEGAPQRSPVLADLVTMPGIVNTVPLKIYPNPARTDGNIEIITTRRIEAIESYALNGSYLGCCNPGSSLSVALRDLNILSAGVFVLKIRTSAGEATAKIIVE